MTYTHLLLTDLLTLLTLQAKTQSVGANSIDVYDDDEYVRTVSLKDANKRGSLVQTFGSAR